MSATKVHRLLQLINAMRSGRALSADELALKLGVSRRTVFRDQVYVDKPAELRQRVKQMAGAIVAQYAK
jgi:predicted DNA-binding transcriptional regulator YafY